MAKSARQSLLVLFIPSVDRFQQQIDQQPWVESALNLLGRCFGGATAFPKARGVWRDDSQQGRLVFDEPVIVHCYTSAKLIETYADELRNLLIDMGTKTNQGAVGLVIDRDYLEIQFPLGK
jgi:hypothetical protein